MNLERFHAIVLALRDELDHGEIPALISQLTEALQQVVADPTQPAHQEQVSSLRRQLDERLRKASSNDFSPAWRSAVEELGISDLLGDALRARVEEIFTRNEITPSTAAEEIAEMSERISQLVTALNGVASGLSFFGVGAEELDVGEFEVGLLIPRAAVDEDVEQLGQEFVEIKHILGPFSELATGSRPPLRIRSISSSDFSVFLYSLPAMAVLVAKAIESLVTSYEKIVNIRVARKQLEDADVPDERLQGVSQYAESVMQDDIAQLAEDLLAHARQLGHAPNPARENELRTELQRALAALADRIDRGYDVEVRAGSLPAPSEDDDETQDVPEEVRTATEIVLTIQRRLQFRELPGKPILHLTEEGDREGEPRGDAPPS